MGYGERIKAARKAANLSQAALGGKIGVSASAVSLWEKEESGIDSDNLIALSKTLSLSPEYIMTGKEPPTTDQLSQEEQELIACWREMNNKEERQHWLSLLRIRSTSRKVPKPPTLKSPDQHD